MKLKKIKFLNGKQKFLSNLRSINKLLTCLISLHFKEISNLHINLNNLFVLNRIIINQKII